MNKVSMILGLFLIFSLVNASQVYVFDLDIYENDTVILKKFDVRLGGQSYFPDVGEEEYEFRILSRSSTMLFSQPFRLNFVTYPFIGPNSTEPGIVPIYKISYTWELPYFEDAALVQLFHEDKIIFEYELPGEEIEEPQDAPTTEADAEGGVCCGTAIFAIILPFVFIIRERRHAG